MKHKEILSVQLIFSFIFNSLPPLFLHYYRYLKIIASIILKCSTSNTMRIEEIKLCDCEKSLNVC